MSKNKRFSTVTDPTLYFERTWAHDQISPGITMYVS